MKWKVIDKTTGEVVYIGEYKLHAEIFVNTSKEPWNYDITQDD